ncbi:unnamed protein product [Strongylus vulgaris]|uniref:TIL domain-containing protein n=1 Tax=Strongylus vulgaris TaxID=40348 RepID=A0A3P7HYN6_STRVU|nr:unnamed protein product [Strongylus vulgaris]
MEGKGSHADEKKDKEKDKEKEKCGPNESYSTCFNGCEPTCSTPDKACTADCGTGGCACDEGFIRKDGGGCVKKDQC